MSSGAVKGAASWIGDKIGGVEGDANREYCVAAAVVVESNVS